MAGTDISPCLDAYQKYSDTIAIAFALDKLVKNSGKATLVGAAEPIKTKSDLPITPDMSFRCNNKERSALFIDFKWTLTSATAPNELQESMKKYRTAKVEWSDGLSPSYNDVIMVVHAQVAPIVRKALNDLSKSGDTTLSSGFAVWSWSYIRPLKSGSSREQSLLVQQFHGDLQNQEIVSLIGDGYAVPEEVLKSGRATYLFIPEPPSEIYTMIFLIQFVLPSFINPRERKTVVNLNNAVIDAGQKLGSSLMMGSGSGKVRQWVKAAVVKMKGIGLDPIRMPFNPRKPLEDALCEKLLRPKSDRRRGGGSIRRQPKGERPLDDWLSP